MIGILECKSTEEGEAKRLESQQRIHFHLDWAGRYLISGNKAGKVSVWDVQSPESELKTNQDSKPDRFFGRILRQNEDPLILPLTRWNAARDAIPAVAFHPSQSLIAVASGSRYWDSLNFSEDDTEDDIKNEDEKSLNYTVPDASLRLFNFISDLVL